MRIAFHTPLNRYGDGAVSGDRRMARQLVALLERLGHAVEVIDAPRSFMREPDPALLAAHRLAAEKVCERQARRWRLPGARPDLVFTYHCHYRAPDLVGAPLARRLGLPLVIAEASDAPKRFDGPWAQAAGLAREAIRTADLHLCMTPRDRAGLAALVEPDRLVDLPPFLLTAHEAPLPAPRSDDGIPRLIAVAMMREGTKENSYRHLARALALIADRPWTLTLIGDGPRRAAIEAAFSPLPAGRVTWAGLRDNRTILAALGEHDLFVWPGLREAYGLVYLEAQAAGLAVAALDSGGVPAVVHRDETALLVPEEDPAALAMAIAALMGDPARRARMGAAAARFVREERDGRAACAILREVLARLVPEEAAARADALP
ncbi:glycosyltransferase family 4 protein [Bosea sp. TWI1241]|uniref:glycosyltransferase family 4 protein n=1 Tax=Bosea sp. TWI1241 TaxID=3148904 RepID=UPI003207E9E5